MTKVSVEKLQAVVDAQTTEINELHDTLQWLETRWNVGQVDKTTKITRMTQVLEFIKLQPLSKKAICERVSNKYEPISMGSLGSQLSYLKDPTRKDGGHVWYKDDLGRYMYQGCIFDANWDSEARRTLSKADVAAKTILRKKQA